MALSVKTIMAFRRLHPLVEVDLPPFVDDFHLKLDLVLDRKTFISTLTCSLGLSFSNLSGILYELL